MAISVNWATGVITVNKVDMTLVQTTPYDVYELDVNQFRLALKDLEDDVDGIAFQRTHNHNPPVTFGGVTIARSVEILSPYTVTFEDDQYAVNLIGANNNVGDVANLNQVSIRSANSAGLLNENQVDVEFLSYFNDSVWVDEGTSNTGTDHPVGTTRAPVNNFADAQVIADARGLYNITIRDDSTVDSTTHNRIKFWGRSPRTSTLTVTSGATLSACEFELLLLTGDLGNNGSSYYITVAFKNVSGIFGHLEGCVLREGTNTINTFVMLNKCAAVSAINPGTDIPILDCNGNGRIAARSLDGEIIIQNKTSGNDCSLHLEGAVVTLTSTITAGTWRFHGTGTVIDNSGGTAVIDTTDLVSPQSVASAVGERTVESTYTADQVMKIMAAALAGKVSGAGSGVETFVGLDDATDRIVSTVDNDGNRTAVTVNGS